MGPISPTVEEFAARTRDGAVVPVVAEMLADALTPVSAYARVARAERDGGGRCGSYLLESVVGGENRARFSFVGFEPELIVRGVGDRFERLCPGGEPEVQHMADPWQGLREVLSGYRPAEAGDLPRFWGGAVGYVSYDAVRRFERTVGAPNPVEPGNYDFVFAVGGTVLIFDNLRQTLRLVVPSRVEPGRSAQEVYRGAVARIERARERLRTPVELRDLPPPGAVEELELPASSFDRASFCEAVERCKEHIRAGDIFQVVLSQRFSLPVATVDTYDVYRAMRAINPSPYMYFLDFDHVKIAGASPETLVRMTDGVAEVRPIAGTRHRGATPAEDARIEREMFDDPKEVAEHVMLVDLGRNDLGRISKPGTVRVSECMVAERYSHVMHITSNVVGELESGRDAIDVLRATFPAGTLSGAPKVRAMQIIEALEPQRRGVYGGAVGYIGFGGSLDVAIAIRTVVEQAGQLHVQAGAGIVEASRPEAEYQETLNKARAALLAIAAARPS